jgi:hypothetical protein
MTTVSNRNPCTQLLGARGSLYRKRNVIQFVNLVRRFSFRGGYRASGLSGVSINGNVEAVYISETNICSEYK